MCRSTCSVPRRGRRAATSWMPLDSVLPKLADLSDMF
ncbi:hypothetical protein WG66_002420 [Moniliophthora roreri]|nr:hypothetical protein WG66_002420 [Moniliophthora roreri]